MPVAIPPNGSDEVVSLDAPSFEIASCLKHQADGEQRASPEMVVRVGACVCQKGSGIMIVQYTYGLPNVKYGSTVAPWT